MSTKAKEYRLGEAVVSVVVGDITTLAVDAIVNSANTSMALGGRQSVAGAILRCTGGRINEGFVGVSLPVGLGDVVVTDGYGLPCRRVFHVATHGTREEEEEIGRREKIEPEALRIRTMARGVREAVARAAMLGLSSLAFPLLATGTLAFPAGVTVGVMLENLAAALPEATSLRHVVIVVLDVDRRTLVQEGLERIVASHTQTEAWARLLSSVADAWMAGAATAGHQAGDGVWSTMLRGLTRLPIDDRRSASPLRFDAVAGRALADVAGLGVLSGYLRRASDSPPADDRVAALEAENDRLRARVSELEQRVASVRAFALPAAFAISLVNLDIDAPLRVANLRKATVILVRYLAALALADYHFAKAPDESVNERLRALLGSSSGDGRFREAAVLVGRAMRGRAAFLEKGPELWAGHGRDWGPLAGALGRLQELRNTDEHQLGAPDHATAEAFLDDALPHWSRALELAQPLLRYRLFYVEQLRDNLDDGRTLYQVRWLMGDSFVPMSATVAWAAHLSKGKLYLADESLSRFLPLHPFLEYRLCEVTRGNETWGVERIGADEVTFATFRFGHTSPLKTELPAWLKKAPGPS